MSSTETDQKGGKKKNEAPLTPLERLQSLNLITRVAADLNSQLAVNDKTLAEYVINLAERSIRSFVKKLGHDETIPNNIDSNVELAQTFRSTLASNGADLPLGFVSRLLGLVWEMSPRVQRIRKGRVIKPSCDKSDGGNDHQVLSSYEHVGRKPEYEAEFPGLALKNLTHAIEVEDDFREHSEKEMEAFIQKRHSSGGSNDVRKRRWDDNGEGKTDESSKRKVSNLPAWMTQESQTKGDVSSTTTSLKAGSIVLYGIYRGKVSRLMDYGAFIEIKENGIEGMVHKAQISKQRINHPSEILRKQQDVWVKVISMGNSANGKYENILFSIKDVNQQTGEDLMPYRGKAASESQSDDKYALGHTTSAINHGIDLAAIRKREEEEVSKHTSRFGYNPNESRKLNSSETAVRRTKQLTDQEIYEAQQLIRSGVLPTEQYPTFDSEGGMGALAFEETEEEFEVELGDVEPAFLRGQTQRSGKELSPIKIVKNPDGSMQRSAMQQTTLAQERRELRQAQANTLMDSIPKDLNRPWEDPLPEQGERHFAQELRSINMSSFDGAPEWKQKVQSKTLSYGIISNKSIIEQRESLPIFRLKPELMRAIYENQVLVVIGETGSGL